MIAWPKSSIGQDSQNWKKKKPYTDAKIWLFQDFNIIFLFFTILVITRKSVQMPKLGTMFACINFIVVRF